MKCLILTAVIFQLTSFVFAQNPEIIIRETSGTVELQASGNTGWTPARPGIRVEQSTIISTGFKSTALISVGSSAIMVRPLTRLSLQAIMDGDNTENIGMELQTGRVKVDVSPPTGGRASFSIQTPSSVASVRGTSFEIDPVNITVFSGTVRYEASANTAFQPVLVNANQSTWIDIDAGSAKNPIAASEINRSLPSLPGQDAAQRDEQGITTETLQGFLYLEIIPQ